MIEKRISLKLDPDDIFIYDNQLLKTASVNLPDNIPYDPNFLYVEVRAVSAGEYYGNNKNIDFFPEDQLNPPKNAGYGKETFMNAHVFKNHDNKDVANAIGDVLKVTWDDEMKGVNLLIRVDRQTSPSVARGFEAGYITDVSMGCRVHHVVCSICGHNARTKADYCNHLKMDKGKIFPDGRKVQEINIQPKFHDISVVLNGAEKVAKVTKIYRDTNTEQKKTASLTTDDMTRIALDLGISKHASAEDLDGMLKIAGFENGLAENLDTLASHDTVRSFISEYIENSNRQNITKIALEQEFDKFDPKKQAFNKLATIQKLSEFEKRIEGEIIRTSAKDVEDKMKAEVDADDAFTDALHVAKMRSFKELGDEECDEIAKKLLAISEKERIPRFEILRTFFTVLATKGIHLTLTEFSHLTMHVLKGMAFEGDHDVFERKIGDYRAKLTEMIMNDIKNQEISPGTGLHNVQNAISAQRNPLSANGLDKMIMALSGAAPLGIRAVVRRPMVKIASYQEGSCSPAGIMGSDVRNDILFDLETMVDECLPLADRNRPIMSYAADLMEIAEMEKVASKSDYAKLNRYFQNHPDKALATLSETKDTVKWAGTSMKHLSKKMLRKKKSVEEEKTAAREDFVPTKKYGWTQKMPRSYSQWEKFRPKTAEEWDAWEDWQNSVDHGDGDVWDKERWKEQKHFAETGETAEAWIARSAQERQAEAQQRIMKQQQRAAAQKNG